MLQPALPWTRDNRIFLLWLGCTMAGMVFVFSATLDAGALADRPFQYLGRQALYLMAGLFCMLVVIQVPLKWWCGASDLLLLACALLFVGLWLFGVNINGSKRWIPLFFFNLQVSELVRALFVLIIAGYIHRHMDVIASGVKSHLWQVLRPVGLAGIFAGLMLLEPDMGSAVLLLLVSGGMLFVAGIRWWVVLSLAVLGGGAVALLTLAAEYRLERFISFRDPFADPQGGGYQLSQSLIAHGRGGWFGQGLGESVQKLSYLPEAHTDFVFSVICEETGVLGGLAVLALLLTLASQCQRIAARAATRQMRFHMAVAAGTGILLAFQSLINVLVVIGMLPTKGLTLPLISYGGSSMVAISLLLGIVIRAGREVDMADRKRTGKKT
jgi:cell division protein FtsW